MDTTPASERTVYDCPSWCQRPDHGADVVGPAFPAVHYGPELGAVHTQSDGFTTEVIVFLGGEACFVSDPEELRRVAADMLKVRSGSR